AYQDSSKKPTNFGSWAFLCLGAPWSLRKTSCRYRSSPQSKILLDRPIKIGPAGRKKARFAGLRDRAEWSPVIHRTLPSVSPGFRFCQRITKNGIAANVSFAIISMAVLRPF
ncbi:MAG: hypothetical protein V4578_08110, partial [Pseudomonadota bacterium]